MSPPWVPTTSAPFSGVQTSRGVPGFGPVTGSGGMMNGPSTSRPPSAASSRVSFMRRTTSSSAEAKSRSPSFIRLARSATVSATVSVSAVALRNAVAAGPSQPSLFRALAAASAASSAPLANPASQSAA
ncbi:hypothetical protein [Saccharomonospora sp. CUA-673]|uniref:hypothetical protein n=1 Tax=Saccharomonospora sp. CUA-673 TaxID=1904969 RepID=UPI003515EC93